LFLLVWVGNFFTGLFLLSLFNVSFWLVWVGNFFTGFISAGFVWLTFVGVIDDLDFKGGTACFKEELMVSFVFDMDDIVSIFFVSIDGTMIGSLFSCLQEMMQGKSKARMYIDFILFIDIYLNVTSSRMVAFLGASRRPGLDV
jgi:hypothetical protein